MTPLEGRQGAEQARAMVVGLGPVGCAVATQVAAAGVGVLAVVDHATVAEGDPNGTTIYLPPDAGTPKADVAATRLRLMSPSIVVEAYPAEVDWSNASAMVAGSTVVVDCTDDRETQLALNDACWEEEVPLVVGGVAGSEGFAMVSRPGIAPCWRCGIRCAPLPGSARLDALGAVVGALEALLALAIVGGKDRLPDGRLIRISGETLEQTMEQVEPQESCPVCAEVRAAPQSAD